ncbi:hypothetical protein [Pseudomonas mosselii]|uniref:hypothetical protein n=1 Tax=Pseudomonas mosselii TaxID=78327 RepID=UPI0021DA89BD|nr:hypothetical protein [Pseudomonas mosselii]MCU9528378.1 hypothetical protein [Pseudomonas mosselii]MCU9535552.1 hypothetical protein [Pseudomonas mosselii]MCU9547402.1 hypothetical protein [Pseudomonas mosselii]
MRIDKQELAALAKRVTTDRRFCGDEHHRALAIGVQLLLEEIDHLEASSLHVNNGDASPVPNETLGLAEQCRALQAENELLKAKNGEWELAWDGHVEARRRWAAEVVDAGDLRHEAELNAQIERATLELPGGWSIRVTVEAQGAAVELRNQGGKVELEGLGAVSDRVSEAIDLAKSMAMAVAP